ncbi:MAG TPA: P22 phage major capsid protein family protein [Acidobacteriaceae bacterium]|nr:P22 phage major capsid protein family protein [Acidobacteriaceae bacterium]
MANIFQVVDWIGMEALRDLINKSQIAQFFNTDYNKEFTQEFAVGDSVRVKLPQRWLITNGLQYQPQAVNRKYQSIVIGQPFGVHFQWDDVEAALNLERSKEQVYDQYVAPAILQIAAELDSRCSQYAYQNTNNIAGVLGTTPTSMSPYYHGRTLLNVNSCTPGERGMIVSPSMTETLGTTIVSQFNPASDISRIFREGSLGKLAGFDWYESNQLYTHTAGSWTTPTVNGANQSGSSLTVNLTAGDIVNQGDVFAITASNKVYNVNPVTRRSTGEQKYFGVTQGFVAVGGGADVLQITPPIIGPGDQYQNVDSLPLNGATITLFPGTTSPNGKLGVQGLALNRDAFALVGVKLETPKAVEYSTQKRDPVTGLSIRIVKAWDPVHGIMTHRIETVIGLGPLYPDNCAVRVLSLN